MLIAFLLSSYFLIPAVTEMKLVYAASRTDPKDYVNQLLCLDQLWTTNQWGYGGSVPGCTEDGMPFMIGKPQIILAVFGLISWLFISLIKGKENKEKRKISFFFILLTVTTLFLVSYQSFYISLLLANFIGWIQFPWRLLIISLMGLGFLTAMIKLPQKIKFLNIFFIPIALFMIFYNSKFFTKDTMSMSIFNQNHLSKNYIEKMVVYKVSEYLPRVADYNYWVSFEPKTDHSEKTDITLTDGKFIHSLENKQINIVENGLFEKKAIANKGTVIINIHYFPFWTIEINQQKYIPKEFDSLGRPIITLAEKSEINVYYQQTIIEKISNLLTLITLFLLILISFKKSLWKKILNLKK